MELNTGNLNSLQRMVNLAWLEGLTDPAALTSLELLKQLYDEYPSSALKEEFPFQELMPKFREWLGDRIIQNVKTGLFEVTVRDFENTVSIALRAIEGDTYGIYRKITTQQGAGWPVLKSELIVEVLTGEKICFTGKPFFSTTHKYGKHTLANRVAVALTEENLDTALAAPAGWKFSNGQIVRTSFTHLYVGPALRKTAKQLVAEMHSVDGAAVPNPNANVVTVVELPDLAGDFANAWFLTDNRHPIKPIGVVTQKEPQPMLPTDPYHVRREGAAVGVADGRIEAFPTLPHLVYGSFPEA
ncbi:MAG: Mu-like prophage major head subunit gpT family protein [Kiritimatiellae bacterium]|jgi:phage major head subunit gpT-like protein|nr:Mu-like prophage major head subunit gpT family protein [Kiritimatiellia bacterium]